jgi:hypothetical protein
LSSIKGNQLHLWLGTFNQRQSRNGRREIEAPLSGSTGIDHELVADFGDELFVSMAVDQNGLFVGCCQFSGSWGSKLVSVAHVDLDATDWNDELLLEIWVIHRVSVAIDCLYWRYDVQLIEDFLSSNVTGVQYQIDALQGFVNPRPQQTVGVRDESDNGSIRLTRHASYIT